MTFLCPHNHVYIYLHCGKAEGALNMMPLSNTQEFPGPSVDSDENPIHKKLGKRSLSRNHVLCQCKQPYKDHAVQELRLSDVSEFLERILRLSLNGMQ